MSMSSTEDITILEMVEEHEIPCDYADDPYSDCPDLRAEWVLFLVRCDCGYGGQTLACNYCKELRMMSEGAVECECGELVAPARAAYSYVEYINRAPGR